MKLAEHIIEPKKLIVLWQAIDNHLNKAAGDRYGFAFLPSFEGVTPPIEFTFEVAGFRHNEGFNIKPLSNFTKITRPKLPLSG